jgi:exosortase/archaeosortase family protein
MAEDFVFLSALPIAVFVNALRLVSLLVIAEYGDVRWATSTWYDWSDFLVVYPLSLLLLFALHSLFLGGLPWKKKGASEAA